MNKEQKLKEIEKRISNYRKNLQAAEKINPNSVIYINSAIKTLEEGKEQIISFRFEIEKVREELCVKGISKNKEVELRARWSELVFLKELWG